MVRRATALHSWVAAATLAFAAALPGTSALAADAAPAPRTLRICADPDNLPFTAQDGAVKGLYVELAELVGAKLGLPVAYTWWYTYFQRRAMRNTILANECDAMFALPANADYRARGVQKSRPFLDVGYALVSAPGLTLGGTLESLKGKKLALQFGSTPHVLFSTLTGYTSITLRTPEEIFEALAKGEAEVGVLWGPVAGYENKTRHQSRWQITPVSGHDLAGQVVVGVRADQPALKARIDQALGELAPQIQDLAVKYGFPTAKPMNLESRTGSAAPAHASSVAAAAAVPVPLALWRTVNDAKPAARPASAAASAPARKPRAKPPAKPAAAAATTAAAAAPAAAPLEPVAQAGRVRFNDQCSHCHGSDGASPVRERDLRRLIMRYDHDKWQQLALKTIREGRPDAGMPVWKDTLNEQQIKELMAFLATIQK